MNEKPVYNYLASGDWSNTTEVFQNQASTWETSGLIPEGWSFTGDNLWAENHFISLQNASITTPEFTGCDKVTVVLTAKGLYGDASASVATSKGIETIILSRNFTQYVIVLDCEQTDYVTFSAYSSYAGLLDLTVYAGEVSAPETRGVVETGDAAHKVITGITDKFYTVNGLNENSTYTYKVKALYTDGTESAWSNTEEVTLVGGSAVMGDVNDDGVVGIVDVTTLIDYLLGGGDINEANADVTGDNAIGIADVAALIDLILSSAD